MGTAEQPIVIGDEPLPSYLTRHINIGFNPEDVTALIGSIESSQYQQTSSGLPHLPAEILLQIVEHIPVSRILKWRLVCRGFRDAIDGRVAYEYLKRAQLTGFIGPRTKYPLDQISTEDYEDICFLRADFSHLGPTAGLGTRAAVWSGSHAVFKMEEAWFEAFARVGGPVNVERRSYGWAEILFDLECISADEEARYGTLRWCMRIDHAVWDLGIIAGLNTEVFDVDLETRTVRMQWKQIMFDYFKCETTFSRMQKEKAASSFTFGLKRDCLRALRRQRLCAGLNLNDKNDRRINWAMNMLPPLWGKSRHDKASPPWDGLEREENGAIHILTKLRREARTTPKELAFLWKIAAERKTMEKELNDVAEMFAEWKYTLYQPEWKHTRPPERLPVLSKNPVFWSDQSRTLEEERIKRWKTQKSTVQRLALLLAGSNEALSVPDNAFDDLSEI